MVRSRRLVKILSARSCRSPTNKSRMQLFGIYVREFDVNQRTRIMPSSAMSRTVVSGLALSVCLSSLANGSWLKPAPNQDDTQVLVRGSLRFRSCENSKYSPNSFCGNYQVFENRSTMEGHKISLNIVVLKAKVRRQRPTQFSFYPEVRVRVRRNQLSMEGVHLAERLTRNTI